MLFGCLKYLSLFLSFCSILWEMRFFLIFTFLTLHATGMWRGLFSKTPEVPGKSPLTCGLRTETRLLLFYTQRNRWQSADPQALPSVSPKPGATLHSGGPGPCPGTPRGKPEASAPVAFAGRQEAASPALLHSLSLCPGDVQKSRVRGWLQPPSLMNLYLVRALTVILIGS